MVKKLRLLVLTVLCLTAVLVQPSCGEEKEPRCDQKAIQQAKDEYQKWLAKASESARRASGIETMLTAVYDDGEKDFDENIWGGMVEGAFNELTIHTAAKLGSEEVERIAPALTAFELAHFLATVSAFILRDLKRLDGAKVLSLNAAVAHQDIQLAYERAWEALQRQEALEAQCKKPKSSSNSREGSRLAAVMTVSDSASQNDGGADLMKSSDVEKTLYLQYSAIHSLLEAASGAFNEAEQAIGNARTVAVMAGGALPPEQTKGAKLTGPQLADCNKWMKAAFKSIAKAVQNYDQVKSELAKIHQLTGKH